MTLDEVIDLIQEWIVTNGNEEITADVLRPILEAMVNQPNDLIGDLDDLTTTDKDNLVEAINEVRTLAITNAGLVIHSGSGTPSETPPVSFGLGDFYAQVIFPSPDVESFWQYNGSVWVEQRPQRTRTVLKFVSLVGVTVTGKSQVEWMAEAINLNISNGAVYECEPGDVIDFFVNILEDFSTTIPTVRRVFTRLLTGATSVTSVVANDLMPDGSEDVPIDSELIIELGDIGTDNVWDAFNTDVNQPFDMDNEMFVSAIQNGDNKLWQWIGGTGLFGSTETLAVEADFLDLTEQPPITTYQLFRKYDDIAAMLADQATQIAQQGILVVDASADTNITFPGGLDAEKKYAYYQKKAATTTGTISDYRLISAPYGNHTASGGGISDIFEATGNITLLETHKNAIIRLTGFAQVIIPTGLGLKFSTVIKKMTSETIGFVANENVVIETPPDVIAQINSKYDAVELVLEKIDGGIEYWGIYGALKAGETIQGVSKVLYKTAFSLDSVTWVRCLKSSDFPSITTSKPYFLVYSTNHDSGNGAIAWGECDDPEYTNFVELGTILTGYQCEYPWLMDIPDAESGYTDSRVHLYYHTGTADPDNAGLQQTHLLTCSGGELHLATWTQRGKVLGIVGTDNHTGYLIVWKRGVGDYIGFHKLRGGGTYENEYSLSSSPDGHTWTRVSTNDSSSFSPDGFMWSVGFQVITNGGYGIIRNINAPEKLSIVTIDSNNVPVAVVKDIFTFGELTKGPIHIYIENNILYITIESPPSFYVLKYNLAEL